MRDVLFFLGVVLLAVAVGVFGILSEGSPVSKRSASSVSVGAEMVMKMTDEEGLLQVARSESLIASTRGDAAGLRLGQLWHGDAQAIGRGLDRLLTETDPGVTLALITALNNPLNRKTIEGCSTSLARFDELIFRLYEGSPDLALRYRLLASAPSFGPVTTAALIDEACLASFESVPGHPQLTNRRALSIALKDALLLSERKLAVASGNGSWYWNKDEILQRVNLLVRMPDIDAGAFRISVSCLEKFGSSRDLERLKQDLPNSASEEFHRIIDQALEGNAR